MNTCNVLWILSSYARKWVTQYQNLIQTFPKILGLKDFKLKSYFIPRQTDSNMCGVIAVKAIY